MHVKHLTRRAVIIVAVMCPMLTGFLMSDLWAGQDACDCPHVGDANGDGHVNVADVVYVINVVFNSYPSTTDPQCPKARSDINADGIVDVRDITLINDYLFFASLPPVNPCDCLVNPSLCTPVFDPNPGSPGDAILVESKSVLAGQTGVTIGIALTNSVPVRYIVIPLAVRSITPGAFMTSVKMSFGDRMADTIMSNVRLRNQYTTADGTCSPQGFHNYWYSQLGTAAPVARAVDASPEGFLFVAGTTGRDTHVLQPGADVTGSFILTVDVTGTPGSFEIDTTCTDPANHLVFIQDDPPTNTPIVPSFTKGIITLTANTPPVAVCRDTAVNAISNCTADVSVDHGSYDPDGWPVTVTQSPPGPYSKGVTPVAMVVTDNMGAKDTCLATVTVVDTTPPLLSCRDTVYVRVGPADGGTIVSLPVSASDNCPPVSIVCTPPSGSYFPKGVTPVTCVATDASGLVTTCSFVVDVYTDCFDRMADLNCDGVANVLDIVLAIDIIFRHGGAPPPCVSPK